MGMCIGAGYAPAGIGFALAIRSVLSLAGQWEQMLFGEKTDVVRLEFEPDNGKTEIKIDCLLEQFGIFHAKQQSHDAAGRRGQLVIEFRLSARSKHEFLSALVAMPEIVEIERK
jgi:hypothetical protein